MTLPPLPPAKDVLVTLQADVLPAAGGAAAVMCLFLLFGRWAAALGSAAAVAVGFVCANYTFDKLSWEGTWRLVPWKPDDPAKPWYWLPRAALALMIVGLLSRWVGLIAARYLPERRWWIANGLVWLPRVAATAAVAGWLLSDRYTDGRTWLLPALVAAIVVEWVVLDSIARAGASAQVAAYLGLALVGAAVVLLHARWAGGMELGLVAGFALLGVALAVGAVTAAEPAPEVLPWERPPTPTAASGAIPAGVVFLLGLAIPGRLSNDSTVPLQSFWLIALAPLALAPFLIPALCPKNGWFVRIARLVLVLAPVVAAVVLADQHARLTFDEEW
jgi:hypothetical protein